MAFDTLYKGSFLNVETDINSLNNQQQVDIYIYDTKSAETDTPTNVIDLEMTDEPLRLSNVNNDEDKFNIVRSRRATIQVYSSDVIDIETFSDGGDFRWYVEIYYDSAIKFKGWLSLSDLSQDFLPNPNIIELIATDGLNLLDQEEIRTFDGDIPQNEHQIFDYIMWALAKTNLQLDIWCVFNIREQFGTPLISDDSGDGHFFKWCYLDAKTFEGGDKYNSCKEVIEKILKKQAYITQHDGHWIIIREDEIVSTLPLYCFKFDYQGNFIEQAEIVLDKYVGAPDLLSWMNDDAVKSLIQPSKSVKLIFNYEYPAEIPCNNNFENGDFIADLPDETEEGITYTAKSYQIESWDFAQHKSNGNASVAGDGEAYTKRLFYNDQENSRVIRMNINSTVKDSLKSCPIYVSKNDKINIGISTRYQSDTDLITRNIGVELVGDDGSYWYGAAFNGKILWFTYPGGLGDILFISNPDIDENDYTTWQSISYESAALPVSGTMYVYLLMDTLAGDWLEYSSFSFEILAFINGSYQKYSGQYHKITQPTDPEEYKNEVEDNVFVSDAPRKAMKGCLLKAGVSSTYTPANSFYTANVFPNADYPDVTYLHRFGYIQATDVYNQYYRTMRKFDGTIDHLGEDSNILSLVSKIVLTDPNRSSNGKTFMVLHMDQDMHLCESKTVIVEVFDGAIERSYPPVEFKYIS